MRKTKERYNVEMKRPLLVQGQRCKLAKKQNFGNGVAGRVVKRVTTGLAKCRA